MRVSAVLFLAVAASGSACSDLTTITIGPEDGLDSMSYDDTIYSLPRTYSPEEIPDGVYAIESTWDDRPVILDVRSFENGDRRVTISRDVPLLDEAESTEYRDTFGADKIDAIRGVDLELLAMELDDVDTELTPAEVRAAGGLLHAPGSTSSLDSATLDAMRASLIAGEAVRVPLSITFNLTPDGFDALPTRLHVFLDVQPRLQVDAIDAI